jgi:cysteine desulfurase
MIYLDNNATTFMSEDTINAMVHWSNCGNPAAGYTAAKESRAMMQRFRQMIAKQCEFNVCCAETRDGGPVNGIDPLDYKIIFCSGASEANATIITSTVDAYFDNVGGQPHIVASSVEHKSILTALESLEKRGRATHTLLPVRLDGTVDPAIVESTLRNYPKTCLLCVMHANNETGAINDISKIGAIAHKYSVPFHCDAVQAFGKFPLKPVKDNVDSFCIAFHKLYGPPGVGALVVKQKLLIGYKLQPIIFGSQNNGYRGGTENLPGIGASMSAFTETMNNRAVKNNKLLAMKKVIVDSISAKLPVRSYVDYIEGVYPQKVSTLGLDKNKQPQLEIVRLDTNNGLPNTLLLSIVTRNKVFCNVKFKDILEKNHIIVSIGSACNTSSDKASHVLYAMSADKLIRRGVLRVSLGDHNTMDEAKLFATKFVNLLLSIN